MKIKSFNQINESSYSDFLANYAEEIENSINLLTKLQDVKDCDQEKIEKRLNVYDTNVISKIEDWIYDTPNEKEIAEFALMNQDRWGTEPQMILYAIDDYATICGVYLQDDENDDENNDNGEFYEGSFQFDNESTSTDNYTSRYYDRFDNEESNQIELYENFEKKLKK